MGLPPGVYDLDVDAPGYARAVITGVDVTSINAVETVKMTAESVLTGTISISDGGPGESTVQVEAVPSDNSGANQDYLNSSDLNTFTLAGLPGNTYNVTISMDGYIPQVITSVAVPPGQTVSLGTITLAPASEIDGTITSTDWNTAAAELLVEALQGSTVVGSAIADSSGNFQIIGLPAGTYTLTLPNVFDAFVVAPTVSVTAGQTVSGVAIQIQLGATISGTVTQSTTNVLIAGIPVLLSGPGGVSETTNTDSNGDYQFSGLGTGDYQVYLLIGGSQTAKTVSVTSLVGTVVTADLQLAYIGTIRGSVTDGAGKPITDGEVTLISGGTPVASATTDQSGSYQFLVLQPGTYDLSAVASEANLLDLASGIIVNAGDAMTQNFQSGSAKLTVNVSDASQQLAGDFVSLERTVDGTRAIVEQATVGSDGTASFGNLAPDDYTVVVTSPNGDFDQATIPVVAGSSTNTDLALTAQAAISGTITDSFGNPVTGATVSVQSAGTLQQGYSAVTLDDGSYVINGIASGVYDVTVFANNYQATTQTAVTVSTTTTVNAILLPSVTRISGNVVDASGNVVPGGIVAVLDSTGHILGFDDVHPDGSFFVTSAYGTNLSLQIDAQGYLPLSSGAFNAPVGSSIVLNPIMSHPVAIDPTATQASSVQQKWTIKDCGYCKSGGQQDIQ